MRTLILFIFVLTFVSASCSYDGSFRTTWDDGGFEAISAVVNEMHVACRYETWNHSAQTTIEANAKAMEQCLHDHGAHAILITRHSTNGEPVYIQDTITVSPRSGRVTYADLIGDVFQLYTRMFGMNETAMKQNSVQLNGAIAKLLDYDEQLGNGRPDLILFAYHPDLAWGIGETDRIAFDGIEYAIERDGFFFTVPDLILSDDEHTLRSGDEEYKIMVGPYARHLIDWTFYENGTTIVRITDTQHASVERVEAGGCTLIDGPLENGTMDLSTMCEPEPIIITTDAGVLRYRLLQPNTDRDVPIVLTEPIR